MLLIRAKFDNYNGNMSQDPENRIRYNAVRIMPQSAKDEATNLLDKLKKYEKM